jgi:hypothetical protein
MTSFYSRGMPVALAKGKMITGAKLFFKKGEMYAGVIEIA